MNNYKTLGVQNINWDTVNKHRMPPKMDVKNDAARKRKRRLQKLSRKTNR